MEVQTADIQLLMSDNVEDLGFNVVNEFTTRIETKSQCYSFKQYEHSVWMLMSLYVNIYVLMS